MVRETTNGGESLVRQQISRGDFLKLGGAGLAGMALLGVAGCGGGGAGSSGSKELRLAATPGWMESVAIAALTKVLLERDLEYETVELEYLELGPLF